MVVHSYFSPASCSSPSSVVLLGLLLLAAGGSFSPASATATSNTSPILAGMMVNQHSLECPAVSRNEIQDEAEIIQWPCSDYKRNQQWTFVPVDTQGTVFSIVVSHTAKCMGVKTTKISLAEAPVEQFTCQEHEDDEESASMAQLLFQLRPIVGTSTGTKTGTPTGTGTTTPRLLYQVVVASSGMCLQFKTHTSQKVFNNAPLQQHVCDSSNPAQLWDITAELPVAAERYQLTSKLTILNQKNDDADAIYCGQVKAARESSGARTILALCDGLAHQTFAIVPQQQQERYQQKTYKIVTGHAQQCLSIRSASPDRNADIVQVQCDKDDVIQQWILMDIEGDSKSGSSSYKMLKNAKTGLCVSSFYFDPFMEPYLVQKDCDDTDDRQMWGLDSLRSSKVSTSTTPTTSIGIVPTESLGGSGQQAIALAPSSGPTVAATPTPAVVVVPAPPNPNDAPIRRIQSDLYYAHCATILGAQTSNGANLILSKCLGSSLNPTHQSFQFQFLNNYLVDRPKWSEHFPSEIKPYYSITAGHSNKCLQPQAASVEVGAAIVQMDCNPDSPAQQWTYSASYSGYTWTFQNRKSGMCISMPYSESFKSKDLNGIELVQQPCDPCFALDELDLEPGLLPERMYWEADDFPEANDYYDEGCPLSAYACCEC